jgi:UDP-glucose 4-epimerase
MRSVSLRYFNAAGASLDGRFGEDWRVTLNLVPLVMKAALGHAPAVKIFGTDYDTPDGTAIRDYVHVVDLADAHLRALDHLERGGASAIVNLGTGTGSSVLEVIEASQRISGREIRVEKCARRAGDPTAVYADRRRAAHLLGWQAKYGLDDVLASAWRWHSNKPDGYAS